MMKTVNRPMDPKVAHAMALLMGKISEQASDDPRSILRVADLFERGTRGDGLRDMLLDLVPADPDPEQWRDWLDGGAAPHVAPRLVDPDRGRKPGARGGHVSAVNACKQAAREVDLLKAQLAPAEAVLADAETAQRIAADQLRQVVACRMLNDISRQLAGTFSMGPAWTLMRVVSGYIRDDPGLGDGMDDAAREHIRSLFDTASADSTEMLDLLDLYAGDTLLELRLRAAILSILRKYHEPVKAELANRNYDAKTLSPAAKRVHRKSEQRKASTSSRPAVISDRHDVLGGFPAREELKPDHGEEDIFAVAAAMEDKPF